MEDEIIIFNASQCYDTLSDLINLTYNWTFDDGSYSGWVTSQVVQHSYIERGNYDVTLTVRDDNNETDIDTIQVTVENKPPSCEIISNKTVAEDTKLFFTAVGMDTPSDIPYLDYNWDFGDGNETDWVTETKVNNTYHLSGKYQIKCRIRDDDGAQDENYTEVSIIVYNLNPECIIEEDKIGNEDQKVYLNGTGIDTVSDHSILQYFWDFADGTTSDWLERGKQNITHVYTKTGNYSTKLIVQDDDGAKCSNIINVTIKNIPPTCTVMEGLQVIEDEIIFFTGSGEDTKSDAESLEYSWDFGVFGIPNTPWNGTPEFEYKYKIEGEYNAVLTVRDDDGEADSASVKLQVLNIKPEAKFLVSSTRVNEDQLIEFDARVSEDSESDINTLDYSWDFGDGSPKQTGSTLFHRYYEPGNYKVLLTVTDDNKKSDTYKITIIIDNVPPTAVISVSTVNTYPQTPILFSAHDCTDTPSDRTNLTFTWEFGDKTQAVGEVVAHNFTSPGKYKIKLTVKDDNNVEVGDDLIITINEYPAESSNLDSEISGNEWIFVAGINIILIIILLYILLFHYIKGLTNLS